MWTALKIAHEREALHILELNRSDREKRALALHLASSLLLPMKMTMLILFWSQPNGLSEKVSERDNHSSLG
jgi:hypothetical protein